MTSPDPATRSTRPEAQWRGPSLRAVILGILVIGGVMTWQMHRAYVQGELVVQASFPAMEEKGRTLDAEGCIDAVISWHKECPATAVMCNKGVLQAMYHCLKSQDRSEACKALPATEGMDGKWVFITCKERGTQCKRTKDCACADAYRAFDSFCRTEQKAVQL